MRVAITEVARNVESRDRFSMNILPITYFRFFKIIFSRFYKAGIG